MEITTTPIPSRSPDLFPVLSKFVRIFACTSHYVRVVRGLERVEGRLTSQRIAPYMGEWAGQVMAMLQVHVVRQGTPALSEPSLFVGNHMSYIDIPLLMSMAPVVFVAKKELGTWPVIGAAVRTVGTVLVDRSSKESRRQAAESIVPHLLERRQSVAIFPSGTTTLDEAKPWKWGAFLLAQRHNLPIQPFRIRYTPARRAAYLLEDRFAFHLWKLLAGGPLEATVEFHEPLRVTDPEADCRRLWEWSREGLAAPPPS